MQSGEPGVEVTISKAPEKRAPHLTTQAATADEHPMSSCLLPPAGKPASLFLPS